MNFSKKLSVLIYFVHLPLFTSCCANEKEDRAANKETFFTSELVIFLNLVYTVLNEVHILYAFVLVTTYYKQLKLIENLFGDSLCKRKSVAQIHSFKLN